MRRLLLASAVVLLATTINDDSALAYPGNCAPATDIFSCLECASQTYSACASACSSATAWGCHSECIQELKANREDCHGHFDPIVYQAQHY